ncbi:MAG: lipid A biosynthesis protein [Candidatus Omnitrophota bacterium]|nr:MAG: lipid A biosynthesis protein [Candidatus Omnitrophota bacterium]HDM08493.1 lipid A biosynthesis protein [Candidatus Omnitrophota bacterium]
MSSSFWYVIGFLGQGMFFMRFLVQWLISEKKGKSVIPVHFWYFSIAGSTLVLAYAIYRKDPVFILGQTLGMFIYSRNLYFVFKERCLAKEEDSSC